MKPHPHRPAARAPICTFRPAARRCIGRQERGVVLLFGMMALVVLLIGTVALVRSMNTSLTTAGNFAFKRDLTNQGERAVAAAFDAMQSGALATEAAREANNLSRNYSATLLASNPQGIPLALLSDAQFALNGVVSNDITLADMGVRVRYVVDRVSASGGPASTGATLMADNSVPPGGSGSELNTAMDASSGGAGAVSPQVVYRISVRVDGPRRTQSFYQSTFKL